MFLIGMRDTDMVCTITHLRELIEARYGVLGGHGVGLL